MGIRNSLELTYLGICEAKGTSQFGYRKEGAERSWLCTWRTPHRTVVSHRTVSYWGCCPWSPRCHQVMCIELGFAALGSLWTAVYVCPLQSFASSTLSLTDPHWALSAEQRRKNTVVTQTEKSQTEVEDSPEESHAYGRETGFAYLQTKVASWPERGLSLSKKLPVALERLPWRTQCPPMPLFGSAWLSPIAILPDLLTWVSESVFTEERNLCFGTKRPTAFSFTRVDMK